MTIAAVKKYNEFCDYCAKHNINREEGITGQVKVAIVDSVSRAVINYRLVRTLEFRSFNKHALLSVFDYDEEGIKSIYERCDLIDEAHKLWEAI